MEDFRDLQLSRSQLKTYLISTLLCPLGGADKNVVVFDKSEEQIVATLKGHTKKVTSVIYHPSQVTFFPFFHHQPVEITSSNQTRLLHSYIY